MVVLKSDYMLEHPKSQVPLPMEQRTGLDNQQESLACLEFAAGLVVGEGSFCFNIVRNNGRGLINPVFQLFMTDKETIDFFVYIMKKHDLPIYYYTRPAKGNSREQYGVRCHGVKRVKRVCETLLPHLTGEKKAAASVTLSFCDHRLSLHEKAGYGPLDVEYVARLRMINGQRTHNKVSLEDLPRILRDYTSDMGQLSPKDIVRA